MRTWSKPFDLRGGEPKKMPKPPVPPEPPQPPQRPDNVPPPPPAVACGSKGRDRKMVPTPPRHSPPAELVRKHKKAKLTEFEENVMNKVDNGDFDDVPEWFTWDRDIRVWRGILTELDIDDKAQQALMALAQQGRQGYWAANELIGKILKKVNDNVPTKNPSGFLFSSVLNARHSL